MNYGGLGTIPPPFNGGGGGIFESF